MQGEQDAKPADNQHVEQQVAEGEQAGRHLLADVVGLDAADIAHLPVGLGAVGVTVVAGHAGFFHHHRRHHGQIVREQTGLFVAKEQHGVGGASPILLQRALFCRCQRHRLSSRERVVRGEAVRDVEAAIGDLFSQLDRHGGRDRDRAVAIVVVMGGKGRCLRIQSGHHVAAVIAAHGVQNRIQRLALTPQRLIGDCHQVQPDHHWQGEDRQCKRPVDQVRPGDEQAPELAFE